MAIKDLEPRQGNIDLVAEVIDKGEIREFEKFGKPGKVCNCKVKDDTGEISMTLWNDDIDLVNIGNKIHVQNGWVSEWQGELQLSTGKFGKLEVVGEDKEETVDEALEEELADNPPKDDHGEHILTEDEKLEEEILDNLDKKEEDKAEEVTEDLISEEEIGDEPDEPTSEEEEKKQPE